MPASSGDCSVYCDNLDSSLGAFPPSHAEMSSKSEPMLPCLCLEMGTVGARVHQLNGCGERDGFTSFLVQIVLNGLAGPCEVQISMNSLTFSPQLQRLPVLSRYSEEVYLSSSFAHRHLVRQGGPL